MNQRALAEILEFGTNIDHRQDLQHHAFENIEALCVFIKNIYDGLGRRCRDLELPPNWATNGIYKLTAGPPHKVQHRFTLENVVLSSNLQHQDFQTLKHVENYSEFRAQIVGDGPDKSVFVRDLFRPTAAGSTAGDMATPPPAKRQRALTSPSFLRFRSDGTVTSPTSSIAPSEAEAAATAAASLAPCGRGSGEGPAARSAAVPAIPPISAAASAAALANSASSGGDVVAGAPVALVAASNSDDRRDGLPPVPEAEEAEAAQAAEAAKDASDDGEDGPDGHLDT